MNPELRHRLAKARGDYENFKWQFSYTVWVGIAAIVACPACIAWLVYLNQPAWLITIMTAVATIAIVRHLFILADAKEHLAKLKYIRDIAEWEYSHREGNQHEYR